MGDLELRIRDVFEQLWENEKGVKAPPLQMETVLLDTGLDSLGFAILVSMLEEELGYDPFTLSHEPHYPATFSDFLQFYVKHQPAP